MTKIRANQADVEEILNDPLAGATETKKGTVEIATQAEVDGGTDTERVVTPSTLSTFGGFEPADATILKSADIGVTVQGYDATTLFDGDIGITVSSASHLHAGIYEPVFSKLTGFNLNLGTTAGTVSEGNHTHALNDLSDAVIAGSPITNQVLIYDGVNWVNADIPPGDSITLNDLTDVTLGSPVTNQVLTFDGANWVNAGNTGEANKNWLHADNGDNFATAPIGTGANAITLGNNASTSSTANAVAIGTNATSIGGTNVSIGGDSDATGSGAVAVGDSAQSSAIATVAIGVSANAAKNMDVCIGRQAIDGSSGTGRNIIIGPYASSSNNNGSGNIAIGLSASINPASFSNMGGGTAIGNNCRVTRQHQFAGGSYNTHLSVDTDVDYSVKLGYGATGTNKNFLHLFSKGKLELYGDEAQYIFPSYAAGSPATLPATAIEGGVIYDSIANSLQLYNGASWSAIGGASALGELTDVVVAGSPLVTDQVLTFNGTNWVNAGNTGEANNNWLTANNGADFAIAPSTSLVGGNAIAIGNNANTNAGQNAIAIGTSANTGASFKGIAIGFEADINNGATQIVIGDRSKTTGYQTSACVVIGERCTTDAVGAVAIGYRASVYGGFGIAINKFAHAQNAQDIVIGAYSNTSTTASTGHNIVIGDHNNTNYPAKYCIILGQSTTASGDYQIVMGRDLDSTVVTTDVDHSVKIGSNVAGNINILHLSSKGKLELYGDEAQFIFPNYAVGSPATYPANSVEGGTIFDSVNNVLKVYDGTSWGDVAPTSSALELTWTDATQAGNGLSVTGVGTPAMASLTPTSVAFSGSVADELRTYIWDGTDWTQQGNSLVISGANIADITALNSTDIAYFDASRLQLETYRWDGTNWATLNNFLSIPGTGIPALTALDANTIAFVDNTTFGLRTYSWDGTNWTQTGSTLTLSTIGIPRITALDSTAIAFHDVSNDELRTYSWSGTAWSLVGNGLTITSAKADMSAINSTDIAFADSSADTLTIYRWDGTDWTQNSNSLTITGMGNPAIAVITSTDIAYVDSLINEVRTYRFDFTIGDATTTETLDARYVNVTGDTITGELVVNGQVKGITPVATEDLTRKDYVDDTTVALDGSRSMTGDLTIERTGASLHIKAPTGSLASTAYYINGVVASVTRHDNVGNFTIDNRSSGSTKTTTFLPDGNIAIIATAPDGDNHLTRKDYVDDNFVNIDGTSTMTGDLAITHAGASTLNLTSTDDVSQIFLVGNGILRLAMRTKASATGIELAVRNATGNIGSTFTLNESGHISTQSATDPTSDQLTRKDYVDDTTVSLTGDTMTGNLVINYDATPKLTIKPAATGGWPQLQIQDNTGDVRGALFVTNDTGIFSLRQYAAGGAAQTTLSFTSNGNVTVSGALPTEAAHLTRKDYVDAISKSRNIIINGNFDIWQRGTSFAAAGNGYTADRYFYGRNGTMVHTVSRSTEVPSYAQSGTKSNYSLLIDVTTADATIDAANYTYIRYIVEGYDYARIAGGDATLSFWVVATKTGTYCVSFRNSGSDRTYVAEYTVAASTVWQKVTITVPMTETGGTWDYINGTGLQIGFAVAAGTTYQTTKDAWQTGNYLATANQVNATDNVANNFRIAQVQFERGSAATPFEFKSIADEELRAQRYYSKSYAYATAPGTLTTVGQVIEIATRNSGSQSIGVNLVAEMRDIPSVLAYSPVTGVSGKCDNLGDRTLTPSGISTNRIGWSGVASGVTTNNCGWHYAADAEL